MTVKPHMHRWRDAGVVQLLNGRNGLVNREVIRKECKVRGCRADKLVTRRVRR